MRRTLLHSCARITGVRLGITHIPSIIEKPATAHGQPLRAGFSAAEVAST
jgi:hypothetical protein